MTKNYLYKIDGTVVGKFANKTTIPDPISDSSEITVESVDKSTLDSATVDLSVVSDGSTAESLLSKHTAVFNDYQ